MEEKEHRKDFHQQLVESTVAQVMGVFPSTNMHASLSIKTFQLKHLNGSKFL